MIDQFHFDNIPSYTLGKWKRKAHYGRNFFLSIENYLLGIFGWHKKMPLVKYFGATKLVKLILVAMSSLRRNPNNPLLSEFRKCRCVHECSRNRNSKHMQKAEKKSESNEMVHVVYCGKTIFGLIENYLVAFFYGSTHVAITSTTRKFT